MGIRSAKALPFKPPFFYGNLTLQCRKLLSDAPKGAAAALRRTDAIVIEHPRLAGGHLGAAKVGDLTDPRFDFDVVLPQVLAFFKSAGIEGRIPLIVAGGIESLDDIRRLQSLGAR